ncbi:hypothetical protein [Nonomuraea roseola]|uniref:Uncharacterized protein n=1 Tax=Nonomuraea roseola TaxID=46179 RepID=A0ABV5Q2U1_9ACTN
MEDPWTEIDDHILAERILSALMIMREQFGDSLSEAIDRFNERHEHLREVRPGEFIKTRELYGQGFYS